MKQIETCVKGATMKIPFPEFNRLRDAALAVAKEFPGLSASAFFEEVRGRFYPRPDEFDVRGLIWSLVADGELSYDGNWKVRLMPRCVHKSDAA